VHGFAEPGNEEIQTGPHADTHSFILRIWLVEIKKAIYVFRIKYLLSALLGSVPDHRKERDLVQEPFLSEEWASWAGSELLRGAGCVSGS